MFRIGSSHDEDQPTQIFCSVPGRLSLLSSTSKYKVNDYFDSYFNVGSKLLLNSLTLIMEHE
jgi:hypothetical protein